MRAVTWTQGAQHIILVVAYLILVVWLSVKQTGVPVPQVVYGFQLEKVTAKEKELTADPKEQEVRAIFQQRFDALLEKLEHPTVSLAEYRRAAAKKLEELKSADASVAAISIAGKRVANMPKDEAKAVKTWTAQKAVADAKTLPLSGMPPHAVPFAGNPDGTPKERALFEAPGATFWRWCFA